jgi:hypothetical protein
MQPLVKLNRMTREAFHATAKEPVTDITRDPNAALDVDIWPYVEVAMAAEFADQNTSRWDVRHVYREAENRYQHVFVRTHRRRLFLVIVLAVADQSIVGHYVLDMKAEYR